VAGLGPTFIRCNLFPPNDIPLREVVSEEMARSLWEVNPVEALRTE
jgi:hypothetical protein